MNLFFEPNLQRNSSLNLAIGIINLHLEPIARHFDKQIESNELGNSQGSFMSNLVVGYIETKFTLPNKIKTCLTNTVIYVAKEINRCVATNTKLFKTCGGKLFFESLRWTSNAKVDYAKTIDNIINNLDTHIYHKLTLICLYCRQDIFINLWTKLSEEEKSTFLLLNLNETTCDYLNSVRHYFLSLNILSVYMVYLDKAREENNELALRFFWSKLIPERRSELIWGSKFLDYRTLEFLWSQAEVIMRPMYLIQKWDTYFELLLQNWLWHDKFFTELEDISCFLSEKDLGHIFYCIVETLKDYPTSDILTGIFIQFWKHFADKLVDNGLLSVARSAVFSLLVTEDKLVIDKIFNNMDQQDKQRLLGWDLTAVLELILSDKQEIVDYVLKKSYDTDEQVSQYKKQLATKILSERVTISYQLLFANNNMKAIDKILAWVSPWEEWWKQSLKEYIFCSEHQKFEEDIYESQWSLFVQCIKYFSVTPEDMARYRTTKLLSTFD